MKTHYSALTLALALGISANAFATQPYIHAAFGQSDVDTDTLDDTDTYLSLAMGFQINPFMAFELGFNDYGEVSDSDPILGETDAESDSFSVSVVGQAPISGTVNVFGRIGMEAWDFEESPNGSEDGTDLYYGVGLGFDISQQATVTGEFQSHDFDNADVTTIAIGLNFKF